MLTSLATSWNNVPASVRDFIEGLVAAVVGGAASGVLALNLDTANTKQIIAVIATGAISSAIAFARHRLAAQP